MKIEHLQYVQEIARLGSVNKAAESLILAQPYLSSMLKDIERDLGWRLFTRDSRGVKPTEQGSIFLAKAAEIIRVYAEIEAMRLKASASDGPFSLANIYAFTVLDLFNDFSAMHEGQRFRYSEMPPTEIIDTVYRGLADLGLMICGERQYSDFAKQLEKGGLIFERLVSEPFYIILSRNHPLFSAASLHSADLLPYTFVVDKSKRDFHRENFAPWYEADKVSPVLFDNNRSAMYYLTKVSHCFAVGQKSLNLTNPFVAAGELRYIPWHDTPYQVHSGILRQKDKRLPEAAQEFCRIMHGFFAGYELSEWQHLRKFGFEKNDTILADS